MPAGYDARQTRSYKAGEDLHAKQGFFVKLSGPSQVGLCGAGEEPLGIVVDGGTGSGKSCSVCEGGFAEAEAGGTINDGDKIGSDASGNAVAVTTKGYYYWGIATQDSADGKMVDIKYSPGRIGTYT